MYPVMMNLKNKQVVVVGGGKIAARKIKGLVTEGASVTVISPELHTDIDEAAVHWVKRTYEPGDGVAAALIFACTNDANTNLQVKLDAGPEQWVNVTSDKTVADFYNVAMLHYEDLSISVSTEGASPMRAKKVRDNLLQWLKKQKEG